MDHEFLGGLGDVHDRREGRTIGPARIAAEEAVDEVVHIVLHADQVTRGPISGGPANQSHTAFLL